MIPSVPSTTVLWLIFTQPTARGYCSRSRVPFPTLHSPHPPPGPAGRNLTRQRVAGPAPPEGGEGGLRTVRLAPIRRAAEAAGARGLPVCKPRLLRAARPRRLSRRGHGKFVRRWKDLGTRGGGAAVAAKGSLLGARPRCAQAIVGARGHRLTPGCWLVVYSFCLGALQSMRTQHEVRAKQVGSL